MTKICKIVFLFLFFSLHGEEQILSEKEESLKLQSGEVVCDGKKIVLVGEVRVQHSLGRILAHQLTAIPEDKNKKNQFSSLEICDRVQIDFKGGGQLYCQQANLDYTKMHGTFLGNEESPDVVYLNEGEGNGRLHSARIPFELKSRQMDINLVRETETDSDTSRVLVNQIEALYHVRVGYNHDHLLLADHAFYQLLPNGNSLARAGLLTLSVQNDLPYCQMKNANGDSIQAKTIQMNTMDRKLWLSQTEGKLLMRQETKPVQTLNFKADELTWNDQNQILQLTGNVELLQNGMLHVQTEHEIFIAQTNSGGKRALRFIYAPEKIHISFAEKEKTRCIYCPGALMIDHENQEMNFQGNGIPFDYGEEGDQVCFEDILGEMFANEVHIHYQWEDGQLKPEKVILEGHVRILNRFGGHLEESGSILHYALADRVEYDSKQQEMTLESSKGNRVLFFDKVNNVQMSAPSLKIFHDQAAHKDIIKGIGDVHFTFLEKEFAQFKQRFKLTDTSQEGHHDK